MTRFRYQALTETGEEREGFFEAEDQRRAAASLRTQGLFVARLEAVDSDRPRDVADNDVGALLAQLAPITATKKVFIYRQLALLLQSGISITEALGVISRLQRGRLRQIMLQISDRVQRGSSLSRALAEHPQVFSSLAVHMIESAEASGELDAAFNRIAENLERRAALKQQVISTLVYPVMTLLLSIGVFIFLVTGVIPKFADFFAKSGRPIPPETQRLIDLSDFMINYWPLIVTLLVSTGITLFVSYRQPGGRLLMDRLLLKIPVIGGTLSASAMSQFTWGMSTLIASGLSMVSALRIVSGLVSNRGVATDVETATEAVLNGHSLSRGLRDCGGFTGLVKHMVEVGERTGDLARILDHAGNFYEQELAHRTRLIGAMAEPVAILMIGSMVGFIYFGFFKAIFALGGG